MKREKRSEVGLYQGMASAVPQMLQNERGF
jgi:hypothetical protein